MTKFCKDCFYHRSTAYYNECLHPELKSPPSLVTGKSIMNFCNSERSVTGKCGPDAKYFEPKKPPETKEQFWSRFFNFG